MGGGGGVVVGRSWANLNLPLLSHKPAPELLHVPVGHGSVQPDFE